MPAPKPIVVFGVAYHSMSAACRAFGHTFEKVKYRMTLGVSFEEALLAKNRYTGAKLHPSYTNWNSMRSRCYSPGNAGYKQYGGSGITMCERWKNDFWAFAEDMGIRPSKRHTIERKDNAKGYDPRNCVWATYAEQAINRRTTIPVGPFKSTVEAGRHTNLHPSTIRHRIKNGMDESEALSRPSKKWRYTQRKMAR